METFPRVFCQCFVFQSRVSTKTVVNKIRCPSCISIVSLSCCSKPGTISSLIKMFVKHITGLRSGEDTDVGGQHFDLSLGYHCTKRMQQTSTADVMSVHKRDKLGPIFLCTVSMSTPYFHTALQGQHRSSLFALKVETNFLFQFDGLGFRTEL